MDSLSFLRFEMIDNIAWVEKSDIVPAEAGAEADPRDLVYS